jgi:hypothetical protein
LLTAESLAIPNLVGMLVNSSKGDLGTRGPVGPFGPAAPTTRSGPPIPLEGYPTVPEGPSRVRRGPENCCWRGVEPGANDGEANFELRLDPLPIRPRPELAPTWPFENGPEKPRPPPKRGSRWLASKGDQPPMRKTLPPHSGQMP